MQANTKRASLYGMVFGVLIVCAVMCSGCAALKALGPMLLDYGIEKAEALAAKGKEAIEAARVRAEAIPDQLDRIEALAECARAERIYQTLMIEALIADAYGEDAVVIPVVPVEEVELDPDA